MSRQNGSGRRARLSERTEKVLEFLIRFHQANGYAPTYREIGMFCGIPSTSVVRYHLDILERHKFITRHSNVARGIVLEGNGSGAGHC